MTARSGRILFTCLILDLLLRLFALAERNIPTIVNHTGPMIAEEEYELQCLIYVPESVNVIWYKGGPNIVNQTIHNETVESSDIMKTSKVQIRPKREDDGALYWCEAKLNSKGPPFSSMSSEQLNITVNYKPIINETKLPSTVPVFRGYPDTLVCEAEGKPEPNIRWIVKNETKYSKALNITESTPEKLYCVAENSVNSTIREVKVVLKEDYLPLIAGLVAITVAFISVIFIFIYSIYYKTAKMGRYSLKDAKPCAQNGNIAQNGKDSTLPMKKVSQCDILA